MKMTLQRWFIRLNNFYLLFALFFVIWMAFFDGNNFYEQYLLHKKISDLEAEKVFYKQSIESLSNDIQELSSSDELFEKFAREKYKMKRPSEDVYIVAD